MPTEQEWAELEAQFKAMMEHRKPTPPAAVEGEARCPHDLAEMETACADGMCPLCMSARLAATAPPADEDVRELIEVLSYLALFDHPTSSAIKEAIAMLTRLSASEAALRQRLADETRDAERYRYLRQHCVSEQPHSQDGPRYMLLRFPWDYNAWPGPLTPDPDAAIDAAIKQEKS